MQLAWWAARARVSEPGRFTAFALRAVRQWVTPLVRVCHRPTLEGIEHLPTGPFLLVANHSAGLGIAEILCFAALWIKHVGERPIAGFTYPLSFHLGPLGWLLRQVGAVPSTHPAGEATLKAGVPILVFPGGMHETFRPIWQANQVDFGGHLGFLRLARRTGVPLVPLGIRGSHWTVPILWRSRLLPYLLVVPRLAGCKQWPLTLLGTVIALLLALLLPVGPLWRALLVWWWLGSPLIFTAWVPATIRMKIGRPLAGEELFTAGDEAAYARVQGAVQALVDEQGR